MIRIAIAATLAALPLSAWAAETIPPEKVLASVTSDWNEDGNFDRAILYEGPENAGLLMFLSGADGKMQLAAIVPSAAWSGGWGQLATLTINPKGSLQIVSQNDAIGRGRWSQAVTVGYREGRFSVIGITYNSYDTLDPDNVHGCDLNLRSGKGERDGKPVSAPGPIPLEQWNMETSTPEACRFD